jgi:hypothetical protein
MALYIAIRLLGDQKIFTSILVRNDSFKDIQPSWNLLFTEKNIFKILTKMMTSMQSSNFHLIVLREAIERDFDFIVDEIIDGRIPVTD